MAKYGSSSVPWFLIDGYNVVGVVTEFEESSESVLEETTALGDSWPEFTPAGLRRATLTQSGFFDDVAGSLHDALIEKQHLSRVICYAFEGGAVGTRFTGLAGAFAAKYTRISSRGTLHKANAEYSVTGRKDDGVILHPLAARTTDGNTDATSVDNGSSTSNGAVGYLQVGGLSLDGATGVAVKVRHSADDSTYADLISFSSVVSSQSAQVATASGTINRHLLTSWAFTGGAGAGSSVELFVGVKRG